MASHALAAIGDLAAMQVTDVVGVTPQPSKRQRLLKDFMVATKCDSHLTPTPAQRVILKQKVDPFGKRTSPKAVTAAPIGIESSCAGSRN